MLLANLRRQLHARAVTLPVLVVVFAGGLNWGHAGNDDPECAQQFVEHDHAAHRVAAETSTTGSQDEHCTLCHLLRLLHTALPSGSLLDNRVSPVEARRGIDGGLITSIFSVTIPSRAPPAASL